MKLSLYSSFLIKYLFSNKSEFKNPLQTWKIITKRGTLSVNSQNDLKAFY